MPLFKNYFLLSKAARSCGEDLAKNPVKVYIRAGIRLETQFPKNLRFGNWLVLPWEIGFSVRHYLRMASRTTIEALTTKS